MLKFLTDKWVMIHNPLHSVGFVLNPEFQLYEQSSNEDVMSDFLDIVQLWGLDSTAVLTQLRTYRKREGLFGKEAAINCAPTLDAVDWWESFGAGTPELQRLAKKTLVLPVSASACETNWSSWGYIVNKRRNRLDTRKAVQLISVNHN